MRTLISSGLPDLPVGLSDKDYNLVVAIYRAVNTLAAKLSSATGNVQYSSDELNVVSPFVYQNQERTNRLIVTAGVILTYGQLVTLTSAATPTAIIADGTLNAGVHGCVNTPGTTAIGDKCEIIFMQGVCPGITGTTVGQQYWLSASTPGAAQSSQPTTGYAQAIGWGLGAAGLYLAPAPRENIIKTVKSIVRTAPPSLIDSGLEVTYTDGTVVLNV